jgi:hypothetical protein
MKRVWLLVVLLGVILLGAVLLGFGAFPPEPHQQQVQKVLPNDRFKTGN